MTLSEALLFLYHTSFLPRFSQLLSTILPPFFQSVYFFHINSVIFLLCNRLQRPTMETRKE